MPWRLKAFSLLLLLLSVLAASAADKTAAPAASSKSSAPADVAGAGEKASAPKAEDEYELIKTLVDTLDQVQKNYVKDVNRRELVEAAIQGMLAKLDPYSTYINPDQAGQFRTSVENEFGGIGIQVEPDEGVLKVASPIYGTPAYRAGIVAGDRIVAVEGHPTEKMDRDEAIRRLKGPPGTKVTMTVVHGNSDEKHDVTLTRELIHVETVLGYRRGPDDKWDYLFDADKRIGYIRVTAFSRDTARDLRRALRDLTKQKLHGLVLDVRFNPGGLLNSAIEVSGLFISKGRIVSTSGRNSPERVWDAHSGETFEGFPMVVLVNHFSASAAEIVSACLQDHKRAVIVGERTWGKGSVQNVIELEGGNSLLKLTTASYKRPSGKNIHKFPGAKESDEWGVSPDKGYDLKLTEKETFRLMLDRRERDILQPHNGKHVVEKQLAKTGGDKKAAKGDGEASGGNGKPNAASAKTKPAKSEAKAPAGGRDTKTGGAATLKSDKKAPSDADSTEGKFVDRQLQRALDYLTGEMARADQ